MPPSPLRIQWPPQQKRSAKPEARQTPRSSEKRTYPNVFLIDCLIILKVVSLQAVSFVLPSACDLRLTSNEKGWLNAIIFVGMMVGGYSFGGVADIKV